MSIAGNIARVYEKIAAACARVGRDPQTVTLVAVSKTQPPEAILAAAAAGLQHFAENRVEEAGEKIPQIHLPSVHWHMIGHIQSRKAKFVPQLFEVAHSVDTVKLAGKLSESAAAAGKRLDVLVEVNVSGEQSKSGFQAQNWAIENAIFAQLCQEVGQIIALPNLRVRGLMTMAPMTETVEDTRPVFASLAELQAALAAALKIMLPDLSMGMTDDYPVAIEEGATLIRVGRAIFGERQR